MTASEIKVLNMIQQSKDPIKAMDVAVKVILDYLSQNEKEENKRSEITVQPA